MKLMSTALEISSGDIFPESSISCLYFSRSELTDTIRMLRGNYRSSKKHGENVSPIEKDCSAVMGLKC
jgi:hypothetical protein